MTAAEAYERFLVPAIFGPSAEAVIGGSPPSAGATVLDVACGTGVGARVASRLVGRTGRVVGLDSDQAMLEMARVVGSSDAGAPIAWQHGNALALPFAAGAFEYVPLIGALLDEVRAYTTGALRPWRRTADDVRRGVSPTGQSRATTE